MILSGVCAVIISIAVLAGGYERPLWMDQCKSAVNKAVEAGSLEEGLRILKENIFRQSVDGYSKPALITTIA